MFMVDNLKEKEKYLVVRCGDY